MNDWIFTGPVVTPLSQALHPYAVWLAHQVDHQWWFIGALLLFGLVAAESGRNGQP